MSQAGLHTTPCNFMNNDITSSHGGLTIAPAPPQITPPRPLREQSVEDQVEVTNPNEIAPILQDLIEITCDGEEGYTHAAAHVHNRSLREEFLKFARERKSMESELKVAMEKYGHAIPEYSNSIKAALHRAWMNIRTVVTEKDDQAILEEAERGEDAALAVYRKAEESPDLPEKVRSVVRSLMEKVQRAHDRIRNLRDSGIYKHA
jgi:uncharacterized protein (TIGR02284 family)